MLRTDGCKCNSECAKHSCKCSRGLPQFAQGSHALILVLHRLVSSNHRHQLLRHHQLESFRTLLAQTQSQNLCHSAANKERVGATPQPLRAAYRSTSTQRCAGERLTFSLVARPMTVRTETLRVGMVKRKSSCCKTDENAIVTPTRPTRLLALFHSSWRYSSDAGRSKNCFFFSFFFTPPKFVANSRKFEKWPLPCQTERWRVSSLHG